MSHVSHMNESNETYHHGIILNAALVRHAPVRVT